MKICPVCNDSFADELNFCDIDGVRLTREGVSQERNKLWSLVGAGLLIGAVVISAMTIFLPRARVSTPALSSDSQQAPTAPKSPATESSPSVAAATEPEPEPERAVNDTAALEVRKKDRALANNSGAVIPNPKAAALASEAAEKSLTIAEPKKSEPPAPKGPDAPPAVRNPRDSRVADAPPQPPELKSDHQPQPASSKTTDKNPNDKKKADDKDKKKGGFLKVFKKIFGKG